VRKDDFFSEFDAMFIDLVKRARTARFEPNCDVFLGDDGKTIVVDLEIAGTDPAELRIGVEERHLFIIGRRVRPQRNVPGSMLMKEIEYGDFVKKLRLPVAVSHERATASYRDGMLTIRLPVSSASTLSGRRTEIPMTVQRILV
jgi:HSP20 family protein